MPVLREVELWSRSTDPSLVRHFVNQTLELADPPYSREFATALLRITAAPGLRSGAAIEKFVLAVRKARKDFVPPIKSAEIDATG